MQEKYSWAFLKQNREEMSVHFKKKNLLRDETPETLFFIKQLLQWREEKARKNNTPRQWILSDEGIVSLSTQISSDPQRFEEILSSSRKLSANTIKSLLLLHRALLKSPIDVSSFTKTSHVFSLEEKELLKILKALLAEKAKIWGISAPVIATTADLELFVERSPSRILKGWRYDVFGQFATIELIAKLSKREN